MKHIKILLIVHHYLDPNSGAAGSTLNLAQEYCRKGHDTTIYSYSDLPAHLGLRKTRILFPFYVNRYLRHYLKKEKIDIVDGSTGDLWFWAVCQRVLRRRRPALITRSTGLEHTIHIQFDRVQQSPHQHFLKRVISGCFTQYHLWEVAVSLRKADQCIFLNRVDRDYAVENLKVSQSRTHIIGNGIPATFLNLHSGGIKTDTNTTRMAIIGSFIPLKGAQYAIEALNVLLNRYPELEVSFIGTGTGAEDVKLLFNQDCRERVNVLPHYNHSQLPELLQNHHIQIFATLSEGFGKTLLEGMACGLAPITTDAPGPMEIVRDGHDALVVPRRDAQAIVRAAETLIDDRVLLNQIRRNAYQTAQSYSWAQVAEKRLRVYEIALDNR